MSEATPGNLLTFWDAVTILAYLAVVTWVGMRFRKRQSNADNYFVAKKKIPGWAVGLSMFASILSCFTFIAFPGWAYDQNWVIIIKEFQMIVAVIICGVLLIPLYRNVIRMSVFEYLEKRFSYVARLYCSFALILGSPAGNGILLFVVCLGLSGLTGLPIASLIVAIGLITLVYTLFGGIEGVVWTEVIQGVLFILAGALAVVYLLFFALPGGPAAILSVAYEQDKFRLFDWHPSVVKQTTWVMIIAGLYNMLTKFSRDQSIVQRYLMATTSGAAFRASLVSTLCCMLTWTLFMLIGTMLWAFYHIHPEKLPVHIDRGDKVFPFFIGTELPAGITGLVLAGLCSSAMSGMSAGFNATASVLVGDFYLRFSRQPSQRVQLVVSKLMVSIAGVSAILVALAIAIWGQGGIMQLTLDLTAQLGAILAGGALGMFFLGLFTRRTNKQGLYTALVVGLLFSLWAVSTSNEAISAWLGGRLHFWSSIPRYGLHLWILTTCSNVLVFSVGYVASWIWDPSYRAPSNLTAWGHRIWDRPQPTVPAPSTHA